jgi:hypothetical protein
MALKISYKKKMHGITMISGHIYSFKYSAWNMDPHPTVIFMYGIDGINPNTGHQWRLIQCVNFSYLPRVHRKFFAQMWKEVLLRSNGNVRFTYETLKRRFPFMDIGIRRYMTKPNYYISNLVEIPFEDLEKAVVSTWNRDFSRSVKLFLLQKFRSNMQDRKEMSKKAKASLEKYRVVI